MPKSLIFLKKILFLSLLSVVFFGLQPSLVLANNLNTQYLVQNSSPTVPSSGSTSGSDKNQGSGGDASFNFDNLAGFNNCNFSSTRINDTLGNGNKNNGQQLLIACIRDILIFVTIIAIFYGAFQVAVAALGAYAPGSGSDPQKVLREKLQNIIVGLPLLGASITILFLINPAATNLSFLDFNSVEGISSLSGNNNRNLNSGNIEEVQSIINDINSENFELGDVLLTINTENERQAAIDKLSEYINQNCQAENNGAEGCAQAEQLQSTIQELLEKNGEIASAWPPAQANISRVSSSNLDNKGCKDILFAANSQAYKINICNDVTAPNYGGNCQLVSPEGNSFSIKTGVIEPETITNPTNCNLSTVD